jgi:site-specific recombinase XerD|tara:strand:+ start:16 stop:765 length:750 start_codon:yes stop_codon:yes gene_type:complete
MPIRKGYRCQNIECGRVLRIWKNKQGLQNKCYNCDESYDLDKIPLTVVGSHGISKRSLKSMDSVAEGITREELLKIIVEAEDLREQALISTVYLTGGRISELVTYRNPNTGEKKRGLHKYHFQKKITKGKEVMWVNRMRVLKMRNNRYDRRTIGLSYKKDGEFLFYLEKYLERIDREDPLFKYSRQFAHWSLARYGLFPHLLRDLRVLDLLERYGWSESKIVKFIGWQSYDTIKYYLKFSPLDLIDDNF